jgi:hypothetical protein
MSEATTGCRQLLDQAASLNPVPGDMQYHVLDKMQEIMGQTGSYMRNFSGPEFLVYAKQAEDIKVRQFAPTPGQSFLGCPV